MKKKTITGVLTLTAALSTPMIYPSISLARSSQQSEPQFAKEFQLKSDLIKIRKNDGKVLEGYIILNLDQEKMTPSDQNLLHAEMSGNMYFVSKDYSDSIPVISNFISDDFNIILDKINCSKSSNTYQVYGCSSTSTGCVGSAVQLVFNGPNAQLTIRGSSEFEVYYNPFNSWENWANITLHK